MNPDAQLIPIAGLSKKSRDVRPGRMHVRALLMRLLLSVTRDSVSLMVLNRAPS